MSRTLCVVVAVLGLASIVTLVEPNVFAQSTDPHFGTWKRNIAKSKLDPAAPVAQNQTRKYGAIRG